VEGVRGKGWAARGAVQMDVLKWKPGRATPKPQIRIDHPIMDELGPKIVHFLVDFYVDWFVSLQLPPSTGKHDQLNQAQINLVLDRLETIPSVVGEVQVFKAVKISHSEFKGSQIVHCAPFKKGKQAPRMVCIHMYSYVVVCIVYAFTCIMYVLVCIITYWYVRLNPSPPTLTHQFCAYCAGLCILYSSSTVLHWHEVQVLPFIGRMLVWKSGLTFEGARAKGRRGIG